MDSDTAKKYKRLLENPDFKDFIRDIDELFKSEITNMCKLLDKVGPLSDAENRSLDFIRATKRVYGTILDVERSWKHELLDYLEEISPEGDDGVKESSQE